jgi:DNA-binding SARP family transcriptional activator/tetratricopeptide (TPR) repeat protein
MSDIKYAYPLILNKVASPQYVTATLRRPRLLEWLNNAARCRAIVVAADAGYGKTTLLWQWEREVDFPCYWYKLDRSDRDWTLHISYLIEAVAKRHPGFGTRAHSMLQQLGGPGSSRPGVAAYLLAEMHERLTEPCTFFIDDWHYVNAATEVRGLWNQILRDAPPTCRFVFSSRAKPKLQFARFKTHNGYGELRTDSLRFTPDEITELFRETYNSPLDPSEVAALDLRTEGWAASLQMIEVSLRQRGDPAERRSFLESIRASSDNDLFEFLAEEVLEQQTPEMREFLLATSVLQQITPEVAERLTGVHDGRRELADLEQRGLFTNRLDDDRYRYHNLFREFLERQLRAERSESEVIGLHIHAASYFETSEEWPEAIHHYLRAGLHRQAARLVARYGEDVASEGRLGLIDEWLQRLPAEAVKQNARLSLLDGEAAGIRGDWPRAMSALERARTFFSRKGDRRLEALACLKTSSVLSGYGDAERSWSLAEEGLRIVPDDARALRLRLEGDVSLTGTWLTEGAPAAAAACRRIAADAVNLQLDHYAAIAFHNLGYFELEMGRFDAAIANLERASKFWSALAPTPFADSADLVRALAVTGHVDRAHALADSAIEKTRAWPRPHAEAVWGKACVLAAEGRFNDAVALLRGPLGTPESLGAARVVLGALMIECIYLSGGDRAELAEVLNVLNERPRDSRHELMRLVANAVASHGVGTCRGECRATIREIKRWAALGMTTSAHAAAIRLTAIAAEHRDRRTPARVVKVLAEGRAAGVLGHHRWWVRRFTPYARDIAAASDGPELISALVDLDPAGWAVAASRAIPAVTGSGRTAVLEAVLRHAGREELDVLRSVPAPEVLNAVRELELQQAPRLYIQTMGPFAVRRGSAAADRVPIRKKRLLGLLGVLAANLGRPVSRDQVVAALWPDADAVSGDNNLNQTVFQLRRELDPTHREGVTPPYVVSGGEGVYLHPRLVTTDLEELRSLRSKLLAGDPAARRATADAMVTLVQGEFLADLRYEDWVPPIQLGVHSEIRGILEPLLATDGVEIPRSLGIRAATALLSIDAYDDEAQLALVTHLAATGRRRAARTSATQFAHRIRNELGEEPPPELAAFVR